MKSNQVLVFLIIPFCVVASYRLHNETDYCDVDYYETRNLTMKGEIRICKPCMAGTFNRFPQHSVTCRRPQDELKIPDTPTISTQGAPITVATTPKLGNGDQNTTSPPLPIVPQSFTRTKYTPQSMSADVDVLEEEKTGNAEFAAEIPEEAHSVTEKTTGTGLKMEGNVFVVLLIATLVEKIITNY